MNPKKARVRQESPVHPYLVDMSPLKAGGGCQLALNFLSSLSGEGTADDLLFLLPDSGPMSKAPRLFPDLHFAFSPSSSALKRALFERRELPHLLRDHGTRRIYTFFGPGLPHPRAVHSVVSIAYPIICYPDSRYWSFVDRRTRWRQRLVNAARVHRIRSADTVVAETTVMRSRLGRTLKVDSERIVVEPPAASRFLTAKDDSGTFDPLRPTFLILSGTAPHKNVWRVPEIDEQLRILGQDTSWLLSMSRAAFVDHLRPEGRETFERNSDSYTFLGTVPPMEIQAVYSRADALVNLSDLESFSNNYLEAWRSGTPLIASDRDFAREICGDSAAYVEPHEPASAASVIRQAISESNERSRRVERGFARLDAMPTADERRDTLLALIRGSSPTSHSGDSPSNT